MQLVLETKGQRNETPMIGDENGVAVMMTPALGEDYWAYRVRLSDTQAIVGFPKFMTIGIGFAQEDDGNASLPYTCTAEKIYGHIAPNKGDDSISPDDCLTAIRMIQDAAQAAKG